jgi:hypothetical protein
MTMLAYPRGDQRLSKHRSTVRDSIRWWRTIRFLPLTGLIPTTNMSEKLPLVHPAIDPPTSHQSRPSQAKKRFLIFTTLSTLAYVLFSRTRSLRFLRATNFAVSNHGFDEDGDYSYLCPQTEALVPSENGGVWDELVKNKLGTDEFKAKAVAWLSEAVQVKCVCTLASHSQMSYQRIGRNPSTRWTCVILWTLARAWRLIDYFKACRCWPSLGCLRSFPRLSLGSISFGVSSCVTF